DAHQALARGQVVGMRFHSAPVVRLADAKPMQLGHCAKADGRWRLYAFAGRAQPMSPACRVAPLCQWLMGSADSPVRCHTPPGADPDAVIDWRAIFQQPHREVDIRTMVDALLPAKGIYGLRDYEKVFCADPRPHADVFNLRGIDREHGCIVVVRPDQYVAAVLPLNAYQALTQLFAQVLRPVAA
ncbi:MAG: 3-hydroxybenzoate 4-monooxygenase, partial [Burkholderiaceae bacterium]